MKLVVLPGKTKEILKEKQDKQEKQQEDKQNKEPVNSVFADERVITENSDASRELYNQSRYGTMLDDGKIQLSLIEALYLIEKKKLNVFDSRNKTRKNARDQNLS